MKSAREAANGGPEVILTKEDEKKLDKFQRFYKASLDLSWEIIKNKDKDKITPTEHEFITATTEFGLDLLIGFAASRNKD